MKLIFNAGLTGIALLVLAGCSATETKQVVESVANQTDMAQEQRVSHTFLFSFDSDTLSREYEADLLAHAAYIKDSGNKALIQGSADSQGANDYNFELGIRRAQVIKAHLINLGVDPTLLIVSSIGPAGASDQARRAVITY